MQKKTVQLVYVTPSKEICSLLLPSEPWLRLLTALKIHFDIWPFWREDKTQHEISNAIVALHYLIVYMPCFFFWQWMRKSIAFHLILWCNRANASLIMLNSCLMMWIQYSIAKNTAFTHSLILQLQQSGQEGNWAGKV